MIRGVHTMFYSSEPEKLRAFLRDVVGFEGVDVGGGWLVFKLPEADMGVHPIGHEGSPASGATHLSFYCDDLERTRAELEAKGVVFTGPNVDQGWGIVTSFMAPGDFAVQLYQPKY